MMQGIDCCKRICWVYNRKALHDEDTVRLTIDVSFLEAINEMSGCQKCGLAVGTVRWYKYISIPELGQHLHCADGQSLPSSSPVA